VPPATAPTDATRNEAAPGIRLAAGLFAGSAILAAASAIGIAARVPMPTAGLGLRLADHLFDAAETLGVGALLAATAGAFAALTARARVPRWAAAIGYVAAATALVSAPLGENLVRVSSLTLDGRHETALFVAYLTAVGLGVPGAYLVGSLLSRGRWLRLLPIAVALGMMAGNYGFLVDDYHGIHAVIAWGAAVLAGGALGPLAERAALALACAPRGRVALVAMAIFAFLGIVVPPSNATRVELFRQPCAVAPWVLASTIWRAPRRDAVAAGPAGSPAPWLAPRELAPPLPPTERRARPDPILVLITVDAVRADAVADPANATLFPTLTEMKHSGVVFTHAYAPGTQTALSLSTLFSSRYFSELLWTDHGVGRTRYLYPADDPSPRFPALLSANGVATGNFAPVVFLGAEFGVASGFEEERVVVTGWTHARATQVIEPLLGRLHNHGHGPLFLYTHLMEPHEPYDRGRKDGTPRERYLSEIAVADAQIGRVLRFLQKRYAQRWGLIVSADHGEAFGEHGTFQHGKTLYDELVHVPLVAAGPLFSPRTIDENVGLVDLGPTILDLFGVPTPATFEGQSLVPLLVGGSATLTRPLIAECRLERSILLPDGLAVIEDQRRKLVEAYDLRADPGELHNLFDVAPARVDAALGTLRAFFRVNTRRQGGYEPPFKP